VGAAWLLALLHPVLQMAVIAPVLLLAAPKESGRWPVTLEWAALLLASLTVSTSPGGYLFTLLIFPACVVLGMVQERKSYLPVATALVLYFAAGYLGGANHSGDGWSALLGVPRLYALLLCCVLLFAFQMRQSQADASKRERLVWAAALAVVVMLSIAQPMEEFLKEMEEELEAQYEEVNRRILSGENQHVKLSKNRRGEITWTLPYVGVEETVNNPFFDEVAQIHIAQLLQFVDFRCQCLDTFAHILQRYVKTSLDRHAVVACVIAYGTNIGLGKMSLISDLNYQTLFAAANNFLRPKTVRESNDRVCNGQVACLSPLQYRRHDSFVE
jgi:hypothetical protein